MPGSYNPIRNFQPGRDIRTEGWPGRQKWNLKIGLEYLKYRRRLSPATLRAYGPSTINSHIRPLRTEPLDRPLHILAFWHHASWENYNLLPALQTFGDVTHYEPVTIYRPPHAGDPDREAQRQMNHDFEKLVESQAWDLIFFYSSAEWLPPHFLAKLRRFGIPMLNMGLDDIVYFEGGREDGYFRGNADIVRYFDVHLSSSIIGCHKTLAAGGTPYYLPGGANPSTYHRLPEVERDLDVVFVGARFYNRDETIDALEAHGVPVHCYGAGWPEGRVTHEEQIILLNRARIVLGFNRASGTDWMSVKGRDFEVPMCGALHLANDFPDLRTIYEPGVEVVVYKNTGNLIEKIRYYLAHREEREQIAAAGHDRAHREYSWQIRFQVLFASLGLIKNP